MTRYIVFFLSCAILLGKPALGSSTKKGRSPATTILIQQEVEKSKRIIEKGDPDGILEDPYLVSGLYYSDRYFAKISRYSGTNATQNRLMLAITPLLTKDTREKYITRLEALAGSYTPDISPDTRMVLPLERFGFGNCSDRCHQDAIDLFTKEGSPVRSMIKGIVVLAEEGWRSDRPLSTSSQKGGNEVIIFDPMSKMFYRYCHLEKVLVRPRDIVDAGSVIGTVGHTGLNASREGRGKHLHLEINQYDPLTKSVSPVPREKLGKLLNNLKKQTP